MASNKARVNRNTLEPRGSFPIPYAEVFHSFISMATGIGLTAHLLEADEYLCLEIEKQGAGTNRAALRGPLQRR